MSAVIVRVTPQRVYAARLLKQLNDIDHEPSDQFVLELAAFDPENLPPDGEVIDRTGRARGEDVPSPA